MTEAIAPEITHIDLRGHSRRQIGDVIDLTKEPVGYSEKWSLEYWRKQAESYQGAEMLTEDLEDGSERMSRMVDRLMSRVARSTCSECGKDFKLLREGNTLVAKSECTEPGGIQPYAVLLNVPSGRIVIANDLRELTEVEGSFDVNTTRGQVDLTAAYAEDGMAHIYVGNTCPGVYKVDGKFVVGLGTPDDTSDESVKPDTSYGSICTDLWWYSAMDKDLFAARCAEKGIDPKDLIEIELEVEPGVYAVSDQLADREASGFVALSRIFKVDREAPKLKPRQIKEADTLTDSHFWKEVMRLAELTEIFPHKDNVLTDMFTVLGNGYAWHDGFLRRMSGRSPDTPYRASLQPVGNARDVGYVPVFPDFKLGMRGGGDKILPMDYDYSVLGRAPLDADPHWLAAGMMFLRTALNCEIKVIAHAEEAPEKISQDIEETREVMTASLDVLAEIAEKRGLDKDGTLEFIFQEMLEAW